MVLSHIFLFAADLYPNSTVMVRDCPTLLRARSFMPNSLSDSCQFADISGFTSWSSSREPAQVFILLQTLYQGFDEIAKKRNVFKVSRRVLAAVP